MKGKYGVVAKTIGLLAIALLTLSLAKAQSAYKGGKGDGHARAELSSVTIGTAELQIARLRLFPNPATSGRAIILEGPGSRSLIESISLTDISGKVIWLLPIISNGNTFSIQLPELVNGVYMLVVNTHTHSYRQKLYILPG